MWVEPRDELHARHLVEAAPLRMVDLKPGRPPPFSPWLDQVITSCFPDHDAKKQTRAQMLTGSFPPVTFPGTT